MKPSRPSWLYDWMFLECFRPRNAVSPSQLQQEVWFFFAPLPACDVQGRQRPCPDSCPGTAEPMSNAQTR